MPDVVVGDSYQQIYSWRGAENALERLPGKELYLTGSFRFGDEIADQARRILKSRPDGGPAQRLEGLGDGAWRRRPSHTSVSVLCRSNAGVIEACNQLMDKGVDFYVDNFDKAERDVRSAIALRDGNRGAIESPALRQYEDWQEFCVEAADGDDPAMKRLYRLVKENRTESVIRVNRGRKNDPKDAQVTVSTGHRSKGEEWPAVRLWNDFRDIGEMREKLESARGMSVSARVQALEEWNVLYVAATRGIARSILPDEMQESLAPPPDGQPAEPPAVRIRTDADGPRAEAGVG